MEMTILDTPALEIPLKTIPPSIQTSNCKSSPIRYSINRGGLKDSWKVKMGRKRFMFQGAKVFNMIPNKMQDSQSLLYFKSKCKDVDFDF